MKKIIWTEKFLVNNELVNEQHKKLADEYNNIVCIKFSILKNVNDLIQTKIKESLKLAFYMAEEHFKTEEKYLMELKDKKVLQHHLNEHTMFHSTVLNFYNDIKNNFTKKQYKKLMKFLYKWLTNHMLKVDTNSFNLLNS